MEGQLDILQIILSSGIVVKAVLLILIFASVLSVSIAWKKYNEFKTYFAKNSEFLNKFSEIKSLNEFNNVLSDNSDSDGLHEGSPLSIVYESSLDQMRKLKQSNPDKDLKDILVTHTDKFGFQFLERGLEQGEVKANEKMNYYLSTLASIGSISPFIGLFGTVWGIIDSFTGLASGGASLDAVAPGIAEALVATAVGLFAAIPAVWFYNYFNSRRVLINGQIDQFGKEFINLVERSLGQK